MEGRKKSETDKRGGESEGRSRGVRGQEALVWTRDNASALKGAELIDG